MSKRPSACAAKPTSTSTRSTAPKSLSSTNGAFGVRADPAAGAHEDR